MSKKLSSNNRVWIELEMPRNVEHAKQICALTNNMLQRLTPETTYRFIWSEKESMYAYGTRLAGFSYLRDRGEWFNLDFLGRPLDVSADEWVQS